MSTIDEALQEAGKSGLRAFTLWKTQDGWQANSSPDGQSWNCVTHEDPVVAVIAALTRKPVPAVSEMTTDEDGGIFG